MIISKQTYPQTDVSLESSDVHISGPLLRLAHMMRLQKGPEALLDIDSPAFVRRELALGLPAMAAPSQKLNVPAPISRLLNIVLGQDGILFPIQESRS